jgi:hypothetical protein
VTVFLRFCFAIPAVVVLAVGCESDSTDAGGGTNFAGADNVRTRDGGGADSDSESESDAVGTDVSDDGASEGDADSTDAGVSWPADTHVDRTGAEDLAGSPRCEPPAPEWDDDETCDDGQDNDGDGDVDEDCACALGATQPCFVGPPNVRGVGGCLDGLQICTGIPPTWGDCDGGFGPTGEVCDDKDNDCDGCVDDGLVECVAALDCPVEDVARPLNFYPLLGTDILSATDVISWSWSVVPPRNSATSGPESPSSADTRVFLDVSGDYLVSLSAIDEKGYNYGCSWIVHAQGDGLRVELVWDTYGSVDLDLHMHRSGTTTNWCHANDDCYYANCDVGSSGGRPDWGYAASSADVCLASGSCPNPRLDIDNISGYDPENINVDNPEHGDTFRVMVHMFSGRAVTNARVSIYCGGRLRSVIGEAPDLATFTTSSSGCMGQTWRVADVRMLLDEETGTSDCIVDVQADDEANWDIRLNDTSF